MSKPYDLDELTAEVARRWWPAAPDRVATVRAPWSGDPAPHRARARIAATATAAASSGWSRALVASTAAARVSSRGARRRATSPGRQESGQRRGVGRQSSRRTAPRRRGQDLQLHQPLGDDPRLDQFRDRLPSTSASSPARKPRGRARNPGRRARAAVIRPVEDRPSSRGPAAVRPRGRRDRGPGPRPGWPSR